MAVLDIHFGPEGSEKSADFINVGPGAQVLFFSCLNNLIAMFVCAGQKKCLLLTHGMKPGGDIRHSGGIGMSEMRPGVHIVYRRRNIKRI
jgi:hypothetical protein